MRLLLLFIFILMISLNTAAQEPETKPKQDVSVSVSEQPEFPGGVNEMNAFIKKNLSLPQKYLVDSTFKPCIVFVKFIVTEEGKIINTQILKGCGIYTDCDKEALRLVGKMPAWKPAMQDHKPIKRAFSVHISFKKG